MAKDQALTPMMEQYFRIKRAHGDALLFFRLGDFYEMFYEDAQTAAPVLDIALTSRQKVPMCGVPYHSAQGYLRKLLQRGYKVAVCEQVEDPRSAKGVVRREVVKVLTPGTAVEIESDEDKKNVYIASVVVGEESWGLAAVDISSGRLEVSDGSAAETKTLADGLFRLEPREIVCPEGGDTAVRRALVLSGLDSVSVSPIEEWAFDPAVAGRLLREHFQTVSLAPFGVADRPQALSAAGALLHYVKKVRKDSAALIRELVFRRPETRLVLDAVSVRNLELVRNLRDGRPGGSLFHLIDETVTPAGARLLRSWLLEPLRDVRDINARLDAVGEALRLTIDRQEIRKLLKGVLDMERLAGKISLDVAHPRDLVALKKSLVPMPGIRIKLEAFSAGLFRDILSRWDDAGDVAARIDQAVLDEPSVLLTEGGIIREGYHAELDELRTVSRSGKTFIAEMEKRERERTGISSLKVRYNKIFGYFIEVTQANLHLVPSDYVRRQTLVNAERFLTPELKSYEDKVLHAEERIRELEHRLFLDVRRRVAGEVPRLQRIARDLAALDVLLALAETAARRNFNRPEVNDGDAVVIEDGRHPVIEAFQEEAFIPNDTHLSTGEEQILIITGPNMGGKSTYLRQTALICILAQMGSFVPARKAEIGWVDRIFTRIGAMDFLSSGQSTFMVEMIETAAILRGATSRSLILLDEVGRGTSTFDGLSIAWAVAEYIHENEDLRAKTLFATHYHELTELALTLKRIRNRHVSVREWKDEVVFLRKIVSGPSDQSYGIHVARLAGIPAEVIARAREILFNLEKKELDAAGKPRIAYRSEPRPDKNQMLLFQEDRDAARFRELKRKLQACDLESLTPIEALNILNEIKKSF